MKKSILLSFVFIGLLSFGSFAQDSGFKINPGLELGMPIGDFSDVTSIGFGATVKGMYEVMEDGQVELTLGYLSFSGKKFEGYKMGNYGVVPIMLGYRHNFSGFYGEGQLGLVSISYKEPKEEFMGVTVGGKYSSTEFSWAIGAGYVYDVFDFSLRYQAIQASGGSIGWIGLRVGYLFDI